MTTGADMRMREEVLEGLRRSPKVIAPKYFYDELGSRLFDRITRLPEYYPTRAERSLLELHSAGIVGRLRPRALVELGAGSADKSRVLLDAMVAAGVGAVYAPVDVSETFLRSVARQLRSEYPTLTIRPVVADISGEVELPPDLPGPVLHAFLGSTIGNFDEARSLELARRIARRLGPRDRFLLGVDLKKDPAIIEAAYNDARGVTAEFNRNVLAVVNRRIGADFDPDAFEHLAFYDPERGRVEMHLVSSRDQKVGIPGAGAIELREGEAILTEISRKFDRAEVEGLLVEAGMELREWLTDDDGLFALALAATHAG